MNFARAWTDFFSTPVADNLLAEGVDVSGWQDVDDWGKPILAQFAYIKVSEGHSHVSRPAPDHRAILARNAVLVGPYHFADLKFDRRKNPVGQADHFFRTATKAGFTFELGELPPALDLEWQAYQDKAQRIADVGKRYEKFPAIRVVEWAMAWVERMEALTGRTPAVYTQYSFWKSRMHKSDVLKRCPLWLAHGVGGKPKGTAPTRTGVLRKLPKAIVKAWGEPFIVQWAGNSGRVPYFNGAIDRNVALVDLRTMTGTAAA